MSNELLIQLSGILLDALKLRLELYKTPQFVGHIQTVDRIIQQLEALYGYGA